MNTFRQRLLNNWHLMRIMRLGIGTMMLAEGIQSKDWAIGLFSFFFLYQAVTDTGCCGSQGCNTGYTRGGTKPAVKTETIEYEEIK